MEAQGASTRSILLLSLNTILLSMSSEPLHPLVDSQQAGASAEPLCAGGESVSTTSHFWRVLKGMFRPDSLPSYQWRRLHERLDSAVAEAARLYLQQLATRHIRIDPKRWSDELDELRLQREPDYDTPGLPLVYALKYMPRRVISIVGSLLSILDERYLPPHEHWHVCSAGA